MDVLEQVKADLGRLAGEVGTAPSLRHQQPARAESQALKHTLRFADAVVLLCSGLNCRQAAEELGINSLTFKRNYLTNKTFQAMLKDANAEAYESVIEQVKAQASSIQARAAALAEDALDKMEALLHESPNEHIQFKVAQDLLDRDPRMSRTKRVEGIGGALLNLPPGTLLLAMQAAKEIEVRNVTPQKGPLMSSPEPSPSPSPAVSDDPAPASIITPDDPNVGTPDTGGGGQ